MTNEQEAHLLRIKEEFARLVDPKYRNGQAEHGGNLFEKSELDLINDAIQETIDQFTYLVTLRDLLIKRQS